MRKTFVLIAVVSLLAVVAAAQDVPKAETFLGYTYVRVNSATNVPAFSMNGGSGQFVWNFGKWIGAVADLGGFHNGNISDFHVDTTITNFLFGPRVAIRKSSRVKPYFQILWGGVYASTSTKVTIPPGTTLNPPILPPVVNPHSTTGGAVSLRASANQTVFAMTVGGGLDLKISKIVSFRPVGLDYFLMRLQNLRSANDNNQHCLRYTAGFNFTFGAQ